ncbi:Glyoxalase-like domain protein [Roseivivax jejudonensis]|uniref:Glyoxalase-like domain protein n=1 Tax=Roseivivax jejudonensis TaxID=1529041 RepID=A0A1X6ZTY6_9RHOB|nr:VOC family protein [Roseivivax jejudonensis]SLN61241.1 Glyoxalase-like domain protein [Roseivivax jejudonensis]
MSHQPAIVPYFSYVDARAAIGFLTAAFGFRLVQAFDGPDGRVLHAELAHGTGVIMLGSADTAPATGSPGTYLVVDDVDMHHATAAARGADIVYPPEDTEFGTRRYRARDPEGHEWSFGTYAPAPDAPDRGTP